MRLLLALVAAVASHGPMQASARPAKAPNVELMISRPLVGDFVPLARQRYRPRELPALFRALRQRGDTFCEMLWKLRKYDSKVAARFIAKARLLDYRKEGRRGLMSLVAGCWNYFKMNDVKPHRDFKLLAAIAPSTGGYDCYSVGLMQPYIMATALDCRSLTMLDIDWRIIEAHWQLLGIYGKRLFRSRAAVDANLSRLALSWQRFVNRGADLERQAPDRRFYATMKILCDRRERPRCKQALADFQQRAGRMTARLQISALHDGDYRNSRLSRRPKVLYLSNAVDPAYTTRRQYTSILQRLAAATRWGDRVYLIHHVGGLSTFGLYELTRRRRPRFRTRTLCKDAYTRIFRYKLIPYDAWMDERSVTKTPRTCAEQVVRYRIR